MTGIVKCGVNLSQTCRDVDLPDGLFERSCCPNTGVVYGRNRRSRMFRGGLRIRTPDGSCYKTKSGEASATAHFLDKLARKRERGAPDSKTLTFARAERYATRVPPLLEAGGHYAAPVVALVAVVLLLLMRPPHPCTLY